MTEPAREHHCPFLNRSDVRCGGHMSLTGLGTAFDHCFGCYNGCPTYHELLGERRQRLQSQGHTPGPASYAIAPQLIQLRGPADHHGHAV